MLVQGGLTHEKQIWSVWGGSFFVQCLCISFWPKNYKTLIPPWFPWGSIQHHGWLLSGVMKNAIPNNALLRANPTKLWIGLQFAFFDSPTPIGFVGTGRFAYIDPIKTNKIHGSVNIPFIPSVIRPMGPLPEPFTPVVDQMLNIQAHLLAGKFQENGGWGKIIPMFPLDIQSYLLRWTGF